MRERTIIHLNIADFAVAVERMAAPRLRERPVIVAPQAAVRAAVYDMSEEAYQSGVCKGMPLMQALRRCRDAVVRPPRFDRYEHAMADLLKHTQPYSPLIEMTDCHGHLFIDVTGTGKLFGPPPDIAWRICKNVRKDMRLDPIWSVAPNKLVAKVATRIVKPTGEYIVGAGDEASFLHPLPLSYIPGIEAHDLTCFQEFNLTRVFQAEGLSLLQMDVLFGKRSPALYYSLKGIDPSPVIPVGQKQPKICAEYEFGADTIDVSVVNGVLYQLCEQIGADLRLRRMACRRIGIIIDYTDGGRIIRQASANPATAYDTNLFETAQIALKRAWIRRVRIRCLRLISDRLTYPPAQLKLFPASEGIREKKNKLLTALDAIRNRFGVQSVLMGRTLAATPL